MPNLFGSQRIHKALRHDQHRKDKENVMEINVASLTKKLREMEIKHPKEEIDIPKRYGIIHS